MRKKEAAGAEKIFGVDWPWKAERMRDPEGGLKWDEHEKRLGCGFGGETLLCFNKDSTTKPVIRIAFAFASILFSVADVKAIVPVSSDSTSAGSPAPASPKDLDGSASLGATLPTKFSNVPLGNVMRVFSARYGVPFAIEANAKSPITGDFHALDLQAAVAEAARQAGLFAVPLGKGLSAGYRLTLHAPAALPNPPASAATGPAKASPKVLSDAGQSRAALLQERARLLEAAAKQHS
jgi:hypothetical protein